MEPKSPRNKKAEKEPEKKSKKNNERDVTPRLQTREKNKKIEPETEPEKDIDPNEWIKTSNWFENITGTSEEEFAKMKGDLIEDSGNNFLTIKNAKTGKKVSAGQFTLLLFEDLVCKVALNIEKPNKKNNEKAIKVLCKGEKPEKKKRSH